MADDIRVSAVGAYVELFGGDSTDVSAVGVYVEYKVTEHYARISAVGAYIEYLADATEHDVRVEAVGAYVEHWTPSAAGASPEPEVCAYFVPPRWAHGDTDVTSAEMQKYSNSICAIAAIAGSAKLQWAVIAGQSEATFTVIHKARWLFFQSTGEIVDPSGVGESVSISEVDGTFTRYDLDTVDWLAYGQLYQVTGVSWCMEDSEP